MLLPPGLTREFQPSRQRLLVSILTPTLPLFRTGILWALLFLTFKALGSSLQRFLALREKLQPHLAVLIWVHFVFSAV